MKQAKLLFLLIAALAFALCRPLRTATIFAPIFHREYLQLAVCHRFLIKTVKSDYVDSIDWGKDEYLTFLTSLSHK